MQYIKDWFRGIVSTDVSADPLPNKLVDDSTIIDQLGC